MGQSCGKAADPQVFESPIVDETVVADLHLNYMRLMKDPAAREVLLEYARSEYSEENLTFYEAAQTFKRSFTRLGDVTLSPSEEEEMSIQADSIIKMYLAKGAEHALNLPSALLAPFRNGDVSEVQVSPVMFEPSSRVIYKSIEQDTFMRFKHTSAAETLLSQFPSLAQRFSGSGSRRDGSSGSGTGNRSSQ